MGGMVKEMKGLRALGCKRKLAAAVIKNQRFLWRGPHQSLSFNHQHFQFKLKKFNLIGVDEMKEWLIGEEINLIDCWFGLEWSKPSIDSMNKWMEEMGYGWRHSNKPNQPMKPMNAAN